MEEGEDTGDGTLIEEEGESSGGGLPELGRDFTELLLLLGVFSFRDSVM